MHAATRTESLQFGVEIDGRLGGVVLARVQRGKYGRADSSAVIDVLDVAPKSRGRGRGKALMDAPTSEAHTRGPDPPALAGEPDDGRAARLFARPGFELSSCLVTEQSVTLPFEESPEEI